METDDVHGIYCNSRFLSRETHLGRICLHFGHLLKYRIFFLPIVEMIVHVKQSLLVKHAYMRVTKLLAAN